MFIGQFIYNKYKGRGPINPSTYTTINHGYDVIYWYGDNKSGIYIEMQLEYKYEDEKGRYNKRYGGLIHKMKTAEKQENGVYYAKVYEKKTYGPIKHDYLNVGSMKGYMYPTQKPYKLMERIICLSTK